MLARRSRGVIMLFACAAIPMYGGSAFGENACDEKAAPCVKAKKCGLCDWLGGKCNKDKDACATHHVKKCGLCDWLGGKCDKGTVAYKDSRSSGVYGYQSPSGSMADLPPNAEPGECYAKTYVPAQFKTVSERHMIREASERIEIVPAQFKWVEERVLIKEASTQLEAVPAEYKWTEKTVQVTPAHTGWVMQNAADCENPDNAIKGDVFCMRTTPPTYKTIRTQCLVKPACVRSVTIPAEYQTVRRQVVACAATTRKVCVPAEYEDIQKTIMVSPERIKWEHVVCEEKVTADTVNKIKTALTASGYKPGPLDGKLASADWAALASFQQKNGLGVGKLSYETLKQLKVSMQ